MSSSIQDPMECISPQQTETMIKVTGIVYIIMEWLVVQLLPKPMQISEYFHIYTYKAIVIKIRQLNCNMTIKAHDHQCFLVDHQWFAVDHQQWFAFGLQLIIAAQLLVAGNC